MMNGGNMRLGIFLSAIGMLIVISIAYANNMTQRQFDSAVKNLYDSIELSQKKLTLSVDQKEHPTVIIRRACEYADKLNQLEKLANLNLQLDKAKEEAAFASSMKNLLIVLLLI